MANMPNITLAEVAVVCSAALTVCVLPNMLTWGESRRQRRQLRKAEEEAAQREIQARRALAESEAAAVMVSETIAVATEDGTVMAEAIVESATVVEPPSIPAQAESPLASSDSLAATEPEAAAESKPSVEGKFEVSLGDLRHVRVAGYPPAEIRDDVERKKTWDEGTKATETSAVISHRFKTPSVVESACLGAVEKRGANLILTFLLFGELWPSTADQATASVTMTLAENGEPLDAEVRQI